MHHSIFFIQGLIPKVIIGPKEKGTVTSMKVFPSLCYSPFLIMGVTYRSIVYKSCITILGRVQCDSYL